MQKQISTNEQEKVTSTVGLTIGREGSSDTVQDLQSNAQHKEERQIQEMVYGG